MVSAWTILSLALYLSIRPWWKGGALRRDCKASVPFTTSPGKWPKIISDVWIIGNQSSCLCTLLRGEHRTQIQRHQQRLNPTVVKCGWMPAVSQAGIKPSAAQRGSLSPPLYLAGPRGAGGAYLGQRVLGQLYLSEGFSSVRHVIAGSSASCNLYRGENTKGQMGLRITAQGGKQ